ncbi:MAG: cell division protein FtsZ [Chloroflexi bacterium]|nr:cell division protein FtsZ [Chloroflexota bacterium]
MTEASMVPEEAVAPQKSTRAKTKVSRSPKKEVKAKMGVANITVVGVGGGGCNTVQRLRQEHPEGMNFICCNTDAKALQSIRGEGLIVIPLGQTLTKGFGAGGDPKVGEEAALSGRNALRQALSGSDIVFVCSGMGGGTGTGAAPVVAEIAKSVGALTVAMVTLPFSWEGHRRMETALSGLSRLRANVDNLILVHNDLMASLAPSNATMAEAFRITDEAVTEGVMVVNEVVNQPGEINVDLADVKAILALPGESLMSIGQGSGKDAAVQAAENAIKNPLLDISINGAKGVLFSVKGGQQMTLAQVNAAGRKISQAVDPDAMIFFGMNLKSGMEDKVRITIIATGIPESQPKTRQPKPAVWKQHAT